MAHRDTRLASTTQTPCGSCTTTNEKDESIQ